MIDWEVLLSTITYSIMYVVFDCGMLFEMVTYINMYLTVSVL